MTIKVAVIDDHELFREGVITMLRRDAGIVVVGEGASAEDAIRLARDCAPDVMLIDVAMPGGGLEAARQIGECAPDARVLMLTVSEAATDVVSAFQFGVAGYILKGIRKSELVAAVHSAYRDEPVISPALAGKIIGSLTTSGAAAAPAPPSIDGLTPRETEMLTLVSKGLTNRQVGEKLGLSERTVKNGMTRIMHKLKVANRVEATLYMRSRAG